MPEPTETTKPTHRLSRITVQEVSLVDRAANKRRFLITKKEVDDMKPKSVKKEDAATAAANVADDAASTGTDANGTATSGQIQQQVKEGLTQALAALAEKVVAAANAVDALEVTDQPASPAVPDAITAQVKDLQAALTEISTKFGGEAPASSEGSVDDASGAVAASADGAGTPAPTAGGSVASEKAKPKDDGKEPTEQEKSAVEQALEETTAKGLDVVKNADVVVKGVAARLSIGLEAAGVVVTKVGRRMAKKRLEVFTKAMDMLLGLMKELRQDAQAPGAGDAASKIDKTESVPAIDPAIVSDVIKSAEEIVELTKAKSAENDSLRSELAKAHARVAQLEKAIPGSNTLPVEKGSGGKSAAVWPLDMSPRRRAG